MARRFPRRSLLTAALSFAALGAFLPVQPAMAQTDEIQVYDGGLAEVGVLNLTLHNNFTPDGAKAPAFPGAIVSDKSLNGVPEWAYGVTEWFEMGLYLPLYSIDKHRGAVLDGFKLRTLFAEPHADERRFVYGANFEFSYNARYWNHKRLSSEIRPIIGWHLHRIDLIVNPILDTDYNGVRNLDFAPSERAAFALSSKWHIGVEEYADYGPIHRFSRPGDQSHQIYAVVDRIADLNIEAGVGVGLTSASDKMTLKLILSRDLNKH
jgi:hypothetical protein